MNILAKPSSSETQFLFKDKKTGISLFLKREDLLYPEISGNKFRKLKYNLLEAKNQDKTKLLTFGGAFSNHISAVAAAGKEFGFKTVGIIRGEELGKNLEKTLSENPTLKFADSYGMELFFLSRKVYREKNSEEIVHQLRQKFGDFYLIPEGGTNKLAVKGCTEILSEDDKKFGYVCCPVGTGGTLAGIVESTTAPLQVMGFSALKGDFLTKEVKKHVNKNHWQIITKYHFGGYGKVGEELIRFINRFKSEYGVLLDPVYTGKMMFGILNMISKRKFKENSRILAVHTGGIQGILGMNKLLDQRGMVKIKI